MNTQDILHRLETDLTDIIGPELRRAGAMAMYCGTIDNTAHRLYGVWSGSLCYTLRGQFDADRWSGPGPCIGLNLEQIRRDSNDVEGALAAVAAHEIAHALDVFCDGGELFAQSAPRAAEAPAIALQTFLIAPTNPTPQVEAEVHGEQFRRLALHVAHRLSLRGWNTPLMWLFESPTGRAWDHVTALSDELESMADFPLSDVIKTPAPAAFVEAWEADKQFILEQRTHGND